MNDCPSQANGGLHSLDMTTRNEDDTLPLASTTVIEFCSVAAGPFCGMLLADMGADVIKIEPPQGDTLRQWPPHNGGFSENFASLNRNKDSIALNLKDPEDLAVAQRLIRMADVVLENNRPGVMRRLGLDYDTFAKEQPNLVYCSISAFGQTGPRARQGGFDLTVQALSGIMSVTGEPDGEPVKCGVPVSDFSAGLYAAFSIASLLSRVRAGGRGGYVDIPMLGTSLGIAALQTSEFFGTGRDPKALGSAHPRNAPYQAYRSGDGYFVIAAGNDKLWQAVCEVVAMPELVDDPRFLTTKDRARNQAELAQILAPYFRGHTTRQLLEWFENAGVPCGPINTYSDILEDEHVKDQGWVQSIRMPGGAETSTFGSPVRLNGVLPRLRKAPPALDANRAEILARLQTASASSAPAEILREDQLRSRKK
ncbi:CaiB/BaiF CoA transferase family protein [Microbaculum sp. FT89]|uniref:CaiB/BaiF CoA transferase family protein n=1 Tax=Microbaculum sp. FT89 TaxID=3447298 RepID=UPI003F52FECD